MENEKKRYNAEFPQAMFDKVQAIADAENTSVIEVLKRFVKLGIIAYDLQNSEGADLIIRKGDKETELFLIL